MNIGEKVNKQFLFVMDKIYELSLKTSNNKPIDYWVNFLFINADGVYPTPQEEIKILEKFEEMGLIKITNPGGTGEWE